MTAALSQVTSRLKFLVAFRPSFICPTLAAPQAQTFQRLTGGRLLRNVFTGGDPIEQRRFGDLLAHAILSGQPHLEEAYWFGEGAGRLLRQRGVVAGLA